MIILYIMLPLLFVITWIVIICSKPTDSHDEIKMAYDKPSINNIIDKLEYIHTCEMRSIKKELAQCKRDLSYARFCSKITDCTCILNEIEINGQTYTRSK